MTAAATEVWGLPLAPLTRQGTVDRVEELVRAGRPSFFITANLHYAMLTAEVADLEAVNRAAAFIVADGQPLVLASRRAPRPLPERVAGSDLIFDLAERAAARGFGLYLLGGRPGIAAEAGRRLVARYPGLRIVGTDCPEPADLAGARVDAVIARVRERRPDILILALSQPMGEIWMARHLAALGVPVVGQLGASLDFVAGGVRRAPRFVQRVGMEWAFRIYTDPVRLAPRYWKNARFLAVRLLRDWVRGPRSAGRSAAMTVTATDEGLGAAP